MTAPHADQAPAVVFAGEINEGAVVVERCSMRGQPIADDEGHKTDYATCEYLFRPHIQTDSHHLTVERLRRVGSSLLTAVCQNEDGEQVGWTSGSSRPVRTLR